MGADLLTSSAPGAARRPDPMRPRPFRVERVRRDTVDTVTLDLSSLDGAPLAFRPGQFTMLMAFGVGEVPISISGDPAEPGRLVHTVRDVGGVTRRITAAEPGDVLGVRGPFGVGWEVPSSGDVLVVAGGIGLAPLRPAILEALGTPGRDGLVHVLVGARTPSDLLFPAELAAWAGGGAYVDVTVDRGAPDWTGEVGLVTQLLPRAPFDPASTTALVCGPEVMMRHVATALLAAGVPADRIRLSLERNMRCGVGLCGHCQLREHFICLDGPVFPADQVLPLMRVREL